MWQHIFMWPGSLLSAESTEWSTCVTIRDKLMGEWKTEGMERGSREEGGARELRGCELISLSVWNVTVTKLILSSFSFLIFVQ